ncbi:hypothetical protein [Kineosporia succinea]|uniref:Uncharacterized protein n=1 Tax=Kineosporia succinea TaxID=84632 RepID=A0ABT9P1J1_9ACTN|nr:hypothetical protein [Kineosporia succinea]MDP9826536.1 hypothetical protein [Kineosporia succinea]
MSDTPATSDTAMPEPDPTPNATGQNDSADAEAVPRPQPMTHADHTESATETDHLWPQQWTFLPPVGSIVTDVGVTFSLAPAALTDRPLRVRCTACPWEDTALHAEAVDAIRVHALRHIVDPRARIAHLPDWLPWLKGRR